MPTTRLEFGEFTLDPGNRSLLRGGEPVALNARYFDALVLLVREHGRLVGKQRFFDEVWAGSVVTDAALTQCIKELRRLLGDDASRPRYVRTVAGHGYSFIAEVRASTKALPEQSMESDAARSVGHELPVHASVADSVAAALPPRALAEAGKGARPWWTDGLAATAGGAAAGLIGGLLYGSALAFSPQAQGLGSLSVLLVLLALNKLVGMAGALGVGMGYSAGGHFGRSNGWMLIGAMLGGLLVGGVAKLLGSDTFALLVGHAPAGITGGFEGAAIGLALAAGLIAGGGVQATDARRPVLAAALTTGCTGALLPLLGGSMMSSSLARVAAAFGDSRLDPSSLGRLVGEPQLGAFAQSMLGALEGAIFGACVAIALRLACTSAR